MISPYYQVTYNNGRPRKQFDDRDTAFHQAAMAQGGTVESVEFCTADDVTDEWRAWRDAKVYQKWAVVEGSWDPGITGN